MAGPVSYVGGRSYSESMQTNEVKGVREGSYSEAVNLSTPPDRLVELATDGPLHIRDAALRNPALPADVLLHMFKRGGEGRRLAALRNPALPAAALAEAARKEFAAGRAAGAWRNNYASVNLDRLQRVLLHPNTPRKFLERGLRSDLPGCPESVVQNPGLPEDLAAAQFAHAEWELRVLVVHNPGVPVSMLIAHDWAKERNVAVLLAAVQRLGGATREIVLTSLLKRSRATGSRVLAATSTGDPELISRLCWDSDSTVRLAAVTNPLATDADRVVAAMLAS